MASENKKSIFESFIVFINTKKEKISLFLKDLFKREVVKRVLGTAAGGIKGFLLGIVITVIWNKVLDPTLKWIFRKAKKLARKKDAMKKVERLKDAISKDDVHDAFDDIP